jgi:hypothetical protein
MKPVDFLKIFKTLKLEDLLSKNFPKFLNPLQRFFFFHFDIFKNSTI